MSLLKYFILKYCLMIRYLFRSSTTHFNFAVSKPSKIKTFYQILEVPTSATPTIIKKNYLKLAKIYHPDVYKGADRNRFQKIQQAYKVLSNQSERGKYDETIGLKSSYQPEYQQKKEDSGKKVNQTYGKAANDFTYSKPKEQINIDEQYQKFFNKKSTTNFQEIRLHQQMEFKAMSENQRIRRRFTEVYTDANLDWKMKYSKSYNQILKDQINQKNEYEEQLKQRQKQNQKKNSEQSVNKRKKWIIAGGGLTFLLMLPFILSFRTKMQLQKQARANYEKKVNDLFAEMQSSEVRNRLRFD